MKAARTFVGDLIQHVSMPDVYVSIRQLLLNPETRIEDFVEVVQRDSMLSVRVIRMAKSQYFGFPRDCENLYQAISLIGLMQLHDLMLSCLCMRTFSGIPAQVLNLREFWRYCVQCGIAARTIGQYSRADSHHVFFTLGLLHEIGHAAMFLKASDASLAALEESQLQQREIAEVEKEKLGFNYAETGAELMSVWQLPPVYKQVAEFHLNPDQADSKYRSAVEVVHLAHRFCQSIGDEESQQAINIDTDAIPGFKVLPENIHEIVNNEVNANTESVLELLWPQGAQDLTSAEGVVGHA